MNKINKDEFKKMTNKYKDKNPKKTHAVIMDKTSFDALLKNSNAKQVAVYFAEDEAGNDTVAIIGVDSNNALMYDTAFNRGKLCPPDCADL